MNNKQLTVGNLALDLSGNDPWDSPHCQSATQKTEVILQMVPAETPTYHKYTIGIDEAARYYGIGTKKLRQIVADNPQGDFYLEIGTHILLKRRQFEAYLDSATSL